MAATPGKYNQTADGALFEVDFQLETSFNEPRNRLQHSLCGFPAANVDDKVIRVPDKAQTALFQLFVKLVQYDIGHLIGYSGRKRTALRSPLNARADQAADHDAGRSDKDVFHELGLFCRVFGRS